MLEGVGLVEQVYVDSAGTHSYHIGAPPDSRGQATALSRGVDLRDLRARRVVAADFVEFDYLLAMDRANYQDLLAACQDAELRSRIRLFMDFAPPCRNGKYRIPITAVRPASNGSWIWLRKAPRACCFICANAIGFERR